ncbi:MAG: VWA domain-containing protein, partial [Planctomycetota bacterium]
TAQPVGELSVRVDIEAPADVTNVYSPSHEITVERASPRRLIATHTATQVRPTIDFQLFYKTADVDVGASLLTFTGDDPTNGYFLMLLSPNPRTAGANVVAKDVVVVLDTSGSMGGKKIVQAREAGRYILERLNPEDRFNLLVYNDRVVSFFDGLVAANEDNVAQALAQLDQAGAKGGTNIHEALQKALAPFAVAEDATDMPPARPQYVIFLTDESTILTETKNTNVSGARIFAFGVGYDVNVRLLDRLVRDNHGRSDFVKPNEPIEGKVASLYNKIKNPVMTDLQIGITNVAMDYVYPTEIGDLFEGDQIVVVGRYPLADVQALTEEEVGVGIAQIVVTGTYAGQQRGFEYPVNLLKGGDKRYPFVEQLWAIRRIGWLLDQVQLHGESNEVVDEMVALSLKHGILTPYTSFLADENTNLARDGEVQSEGRAQAEALGDDVTGGAGQRGAATRQDLNEADRPADAAPTPSADSGDADGGVAMVGNADQDSYEAGEVERVRNVRRAGNQGIYRRGDIWVAANAAHVDLEADTDEIEVVQRMTEAYFELVRANTQAENQVFATQQAGEKLLIALRGQVYLIE